MQLQRQQSTHLVEILTTERQWCKLTERFHLRVNCLLRVDVVGGVRSLIEGENDGHIGDGTTPHRSNCSRISCNLGNNTSADKAMRSDGQRYIAVGKIRWNSLRYTRRNVNEEFGKRLGIFGRSGVARK